MDPVWTNVAALLHFDATLDTTTTTDSSSYARSVVVNPAAPGTGNQITSNNPKFGPGCAQVNSAGYFEVRDIQPAAQNQLTQDFTIECWVLAAPSQANTFAGVWHFGGGLTFSGPSGIVLTAAGVYANTSQGAGAWQVGGLGSGQIPALFVGEWRHCAVTLQGQVLSLFIHGNRVAQQTLVAGINIMNRSGNNWQMRIGQQNTTGNLTANIDEFRLTMGEALYTTATYEVPTAPFPDGDDTLPQVYNSTLEVVTQDDSFEPTPTMQVNTVAQQVLFMQPTARRVYDTTLEVLSEDTSFEPPSVWSANNVGQQIAFVPINVRSVSNAGVEVIASGNTPFLTSNYAMEVMSGLPFSVTASTYSIETLAASTFDPPSFSQQHCWIIN